MAKIEIKDLSMDYGEKNTRFTALRGVNLDIQKGEFVSLLGESGCGKSTLLSIVDGLRKPSNGKIFIDGKEVNQPGVDRSVVFQNYSLFPWMTARKNVAYGIAQALPNLKKAERYEIADEFLEKVGLTEFKNKYPLQLSGGQQQRTAIARALAMNTEILLLDEPFGALDPKTRSSLQDLLLSLWGAEKEKKTVLFVTHDIDEAIFLSDRIVVMKPHPGRIYKEVKVPFSRPRDRESLIETAEYRNFRNSIVLSYYEAEREEKENESEKAFSESNAFNVRRFGTDTVPTAAHR